MGNGINSWEERGGKEVRKAEWGRELRGEGEKEGERVKRKKTGKRGRARIGRRRGE